MQVEGYRSYHFSFRMYIGCMVTSYEQMFGENPSTKVTSRLVVYRLLTFISDLTFPASADTINSPAVLVMRDSALARMDKAQRRSLWIYSSICRRSARAMLHPKEFTHIDKCKFKLKGTGPITSFHLGGDFIQDEDGTLCLKPHKYINCLVASYKQPDVWRETRHQGDLTLKQEGTKTQN